MCPISGSHVFKNSGIIPEFLKRWLQKYCLMLVSLVRFCFFIYLFIFFLHFFCSKSIRKKYKGSLADIYKLKIFFSPPPPSLPRCFANLAPLSLKRLLTAQRFGFEFGARSEIRTKSLDLAFRLAS